MPIPTYDDLFSPLFRAIRELGGSASIEEQEDKVAAILHLTENDLSEIHRGNRTKFSYRLAWARNYLKKFGVLNNSSRGVWALTAEGQKRTDVLKSDIKKHVRGLRKKIDLKELSEEVDEAAEILEWHDRVLKIIRSIEPSAFERLCQRILRESGFTSVEVTGRSGDGGIDGKGVLRIGGLISFHVIFQCKRYQGSISPSEIRDFRGSMVGRTDKGLFITTGTFSREARREAQRDGAPPLELIDGDELVQKLKELELGVEIRERIVKEVVVNDDYYKNL